MSEIRTRLQGGTPFFPNMLNNGSVEVCLKEDVDKVLAKKDKELRHQKYKRCLAMAKWCHDMWFLLRFDKKAEKSVFYWRWWNIWLELAEKFKEAK